MHNVDIGVFDTCMRDVYGNVRPLCAFPSSVMSGAAYSKTHGTTDKANQITRVEGKNLGNEVTPLDNSPEYGQDVNANAEDDWYIIYILRPSTVDVQ